MGFHPWHHCFSSMNYGWFFDHGMHDSPDGKPMIHEKCPSSFPSSPKKRGKLHECVLTFEVVDLYDLGIQEYHFLCLVMLLFLQAEKKLQSAVGHLLSSLTSGFQQRPVYHRSLFIESLSKALCYNESIVYVSYLPWLTPAHLN